MKKVQGRNIVVHMTFCKEISLITKTVKSKRQDDNPKHKGPYGLHKEFGVK